MRIHFLFALVVLVFLSNCTVEKRLHRPGWHVEWKKKYRATLIITPETKSLQSYTSEPNNLESNHTTSKLQETSESAIEEQINWETIDETDAENFREAVKISQGKIENSISPKSHQQGQKSTKEQKFKPKLAKELRQNNDPAGVAFASFMIIVLVVGGLILLALLSYIGVTIQAPFWLGAFLLAIAGLFIIFVILTAIRRKKRPKPITFKRESISKEGERSNEQVHVENPEVEVKKEPTEAESLEKRKQNKGAVIFLGICLLAILIFVLI